MRFKPYVVVGVVVAVVIIVFLFLYHTGLPWQGRGDGDDQLAVCQSSLSQCRSRVAELTQRIEELQQTITGLQQEKTGLEADIRDLEETRTALEKQLEELKKKYSELEVLLEACRLEKENLTKRLEDTLFSLKLCRIAKENIESWVSTTMKELRKLEELVGILRVYSSRLRHENTLLSQRLEEARRQVEYLSRQVEQLTTRNRELERELRYAGKQVKYLSKQVEELKSINKELSQKLEAANKQIEYLSSQLEQLTADMAELSTRLAELSIRLKELEKEYTALVNNITYINMWHGIFYNISDIHVFYDMVLESATRAIERVVDPEEFNGRAGERAFKVFEYVLMMLSYTHDSYIRYFDLENKTIAVRQEVFMLPNETWLNKAGDCEDLALFTYALLKASIRPGERVYLITWVTNNSGHAAVLLVHGDGENKKYYIIDPAGNYFNGIGIFLEINIVDQNGKIISLRLSPLTLYRGAKILLSLSTIRYLDYIDGGYVDDPTIYYYSDPLVALRRWLKYWDITDKVIIEIHDVGVHEFFTSPEELAEWLKDH